MEKISAIYKITNIINNKIYIGSAKNVYKRWSLHRSLLNKYKHHSILLQRAWNKYKSENFIFEIIEVVNENYLIEREQYYLDTLLYANDFISNKNKLFFKLGYNVNPIANSQAGRIITENTKNKLSLRKSGKNNPMYGKYGKDNPNFGSKRTIETKDKMSKIQSGKNNPMYGKYGKDNPESKKIIQSDLFGNIVRVWDSGSDIVRELKYSGGNISSCCNKKLKSGKPKKYKNSYWKFL